MMRQSYHPCYCHHSTFFFGWQTERFSTASKRKDDQSEEPDNKKANGTSLCSTILAILFSTHGEELNLRNPMPSDERDSKTIPG